MGRATKAINVKKDKAKKYPAVPEGFPQSVLPLPPEIPHFFEQSGTFGECSSLILLFIGSIPSLGLLSAR